MNRRLIHIVVILSILAFLFASAFKPQPVTHISLLSVSFLREKGVTFKFLVDGDIRKSDLRGNVLVNGRDLRLYCNYSGDPTPVVVVCTSARGTAKFAGRLGVVTVAGRSFYFVVPARTTAR